MKSPFFKQQLAIYPEKPTEVGILTNDTLCWQQAGQKQLDLDDVVGASMCNRDETFCLIVHAYPKLKVGRSIHKQQRVLREYCFTCPNSEVRSQWYRAINNTLVGKAIDAEFKPRRLQVIINPVSGRKQALAIFERVRSLFDRSNLQYTVTQTYSAADTRNLVKQMDLSQIDGLVIVGGDGTIHDAIAGLMSRTDAKTAIELPLGIIPGGTANGLSKTLLELSGESYDPLNAAFLIVKGKQQPLDLAAIEQNDSKYYSFLSLAWGLIADVDIESEKFRFLGALRVDLYALFLLSTLRTYRGRFSFIPHPDCKFASSHLLSPSEWVVIDDEFVFIWAMNTAWAAYDMNVTPHAKINDGSMDVLIMRKGTPRLEILQALWRCGRGKHLDLPHLEYYKVRAFRLEPLTERGILVVDGEPVDYSPIEVEVIPNLARINC